MKSLVFGANGQDGSYLSELLASKGYDVFGVVRHSSTSPSNLWRLKKALEYKNFKLVDGDLTDSLSIHNIIRNVQPDELYNLAAQSFVGLSFEAPEMTFDVNALGFMRIMEGIKKYSSKTKVYHASTSELFGISPAPQNEDTPLKPQSPYGVAKLAAHEMARYYRNFGLFVSCGILFNHESITEDTPVIIRRDGLMDITTPNDLIGMDSTFQTLQKQPDNLDIWDGNKWSKVKLITSYRHRTKNENKRVRRIVTRNGMIETTGDHVWIMKDGTEVKASDIQKGNIVSNVDLPTTTCQTIISKEEAKLIGYLISDGSMQNQLVFSNTDQRLADDVEQLWKKLSGGVVRKIDMLGSYKPNPDKPIHRLELKGNPRYADMLKEECTTKKGDVKIPIRILNADPKTIEAFFEGYYEGDGLKAKNGCTYKYRRSGTVSNVLAMGLWWIVKKILSQETRYQIYYKKEGKEFQNYLDYLSPNAKKGNHLRKERGEVTSIKELPNYEGRLFDFETESGTFHCGVGSIKVHNSPRRTPEFVTKKIIQNLVRIAIEIKEDAPSYPLKLGNLDAKRDWGYSPEYVEAQWRMLQLDKPDDIVIATGETYTISYFLEESKKAVALHMGIDPKDFDPRIKIDDSLKRVSEVWELRGDPSKAKRVLNWEAKVKTPQLIQIMVAQEIHGEL